MKPPIKPASTARVKEPSRRSVRPETDPTAARQISSVIPASEPSTMYGSTRRSHRNIAHDGMPAYSSPQPRIVMTTPPTRLEPAWQAGPSREQEQREIGQQQTPQSDEYAVPRERSSPSGRLGLSFVVPTGGQRRSEARPESRWMASGPSFLLIGNAQAATDGIGRPDGNPSAATLCGLSHRTGRGRSWPAEPGRQADQTPRVAHGTLGGADRPGLERHRRLEHISCPRARGGRRGPPRRISRPRRRSGRWAQVPRARSCARRTSSCRSRACQLADQLVIGAAAARQRVLPMNSRTLAGQSRPEGRIAQQGDTAMAISWISAGGATDPRPRMTDGTPPTLVATIGQACPIASSKVIGIASEMLIIRTRSPLRIAA